MSDRTYAKAQAQQKTVSGSLPKSSLLQRTCACGLHTIAGGECDACRREQSTLLRAQRVLEPPSAPGAGPGSSPAQEHGTSSNAAFDSASRFGHDFTRIPTHSTQTSVPQTKLKINQPGDVYEQQADQIAEKVMNLSSPNESRNGLPARKEGESLQAAQHMSSTNDPRVSGSVDRPLEPSTQTFMETRFGHDFSKVRIHTDARAAESARSVNALAYTVGRDIVFGAEQYAPRTTAGQRLLAHELTHVVQQSSYLGTPASTTVMRAVDAPPTKEALEKEILALSLELLVITPILYTLVFPKKVLEMQKLLKLKLDLLGVTDATQQKIFFYRTRIFELTQKKGTAPSLSSQEDQDIFEYEVALAEALKKNIQRLQTEISTLRKSSISGPALARAQAELVQNEAEEKALSMIFSPVDVKEFEQPYKEVKGKCMATFIRGLGGLYTEKEATSIKKEAITAAEKHDKPLGLTGKHDTYSVDRLMDAVRSHGRAGTTMIFKHNAKTGRWEPDIEASLLKETSPDCPGWYFFGASLSGAFHSVIFAVNILGDGRHKVYWMDEFSTEGFSDMYEARAYHTAKNNVTGHIDEKMSLAADAAKHFDAPTKIWPLIPTR